MLAIVDQRIPQKAEEALVRLGCSILRLPPHPTLPAPVASHPDMLIFFAPDAVFCTKSYRKIAKKALDSISDACRRPIRTVTEEYGDAYPRDILLNAAPIGKRLFCLDTHTATELKEAPSYRICSVKQGYAKCSVIPIGADAMITDDVSIARVAEREGVSVLQIAKNAVRLSGYDTGFIGGAASFSPYAQIPEILFCGDLNQHPSAAEIVGFCERHGKTPLSLSNDPLTDIGTIFLI